MTTIHLQVHSSWAERDNAHALEHGREPRFPSVEWAGDIEVDNVIDPGDVNDQIFRLFNRVDEEDSVRLDRWGYELPSLSMGDTIAWGLTDDALTRFRVESIGFSEMESSLQDAGLVDEHGVYTQKAFDIIDRSSS